MHAALLRQHLDAEYHLLRAAVRAHLTAPVPTCPGWTGDDLARHVAVTYLHKAECIRLGTAPLPWPPDLSGEASLPLLDRAFAELTAEFAARPPDAPAATWHTPDQTVGFWIRRMTQETLVHRIDAELCAGAGVSPVDAELAADGVDEVLTCFLRYGTHRWDPAFTPARPAPDQPPVLVATPERAWLVQAVPGGVRVRPTAPGTAAPAVIEGPADALLRWLWNRGTDQVHTSGAPTLIDSLHAHLRTATR